MTYANADKKKATRRAYELRWREENPEKWKNVKWRHHLMGRHNMTPEDFQDMLDAQGGVCAICGGSSPDRMGLHVDHDHATGKTRGILCAHCNRGLGSFKDSTDTLAAAIGYLKERS